MITEERIDIPRQGDFELAQLVEEGLPPDSLSMLKEKGLTFTEIAELVIAPRTLKHRKARGENLSGEETERLLRVARIISKADATFGNHSKALLWLRSRDQRLNGRTQLSMLRTEAGGRVIENMLGQIAEGMFS